MCHSCVRLASPFSVSLGYLIVANYVLVVLSILRPIGEVSF